MIRKNEVMQLLLDACPSYKHKWIEHCEFNYSNGEKQLLYLDLGDFACHLIELYKINELNEFKQIFDVIELLHIRGDDFVKEAASIGLLEGIQNVALNNGLNPEEFVKFLKPISYEWWKKLNEFWIGTINFVVRTNKE